MIWLLQASLIIQNRCDYAAPKINNLIGQTNCLMFFINIIDWTWTIICNLTVGSKVILLRIELYKGYRIIYFIKYYIFCEWI